METQDHTTILSGCLAEIEAKSYRQNSSRSRPGLLQESGPEERGRKQSSDDDLVIGVNCVTLH